MTIPMFSTPALILTIGMSMLPAIMEVKRIYFQTDPHREMTTRFIALQMLSRKGDMGWASLEDALVTKGTPCAWREAYEQSQNLIEHLKAGIQSSLHELRSHEKLIEVGLGGKTALPLDVYLIADLSEPDASVLLSLLPAIQVLLADEPYAAIHVLLNIAVFDKAPAPLVNVHVTLNTLFRLFQSRTQYHIPQVYLFDRLKEGIWEGQDIQEVQTIQGNFLLALLSGGLAQQITHQLSQSDMEQYQAYFCSASAAAVVLDMEQLQNACALRLGQEIIENEFHSKVDPNPGPIQELTGNFLKDHANPLVWGMRLCRDTLFQMQAEGLEVHISDLKFEDVLMEDWGKIIQEYDDKFKDKHLPAQVEMLNKNSAELDREFLEELASFGLSLPRQARLYPGGIQSTRWILERIRRTLVDEGTTTSDSSGLEVEWNTRIKTSLETLESEIRLLPKPPRWILRLPAILKKQTVQLFDLIYLHRELGTITELRQTSVQLLEQKYAVLMDVMLTQKLIELKKNWVTAIDRQIRAVKRLQSNLDAIQFNLKIEMEAKMSSSSMFRLSAMNDILLAWAYYSGKRPQAGFRHALLTEQDFLSDWQKKSRKTLQGHLMEFCRKVYQTLSDMDLEEALAHRNGREANDLTTTLSQRAIPLLRPNFDQTGSGPSYQMRFFLSRDPRQSSVLPIIKGDMQDWQEISTGDPYQAICCRVRVMIPFSALSHIFQRGREAYDALDDHAKSQYSLPQEVE